MKLPIKVLVAASVVCSAIFLAFVVDPQLRGARDAVAFKVASILLLAVPAGFAGRKWLAIALAFSALGDLSLGVQRLGSLSPVQLFLLGLSAFLVAHVFYVVLFAKNRTESISNGRKVASIAVLIVAIVTLIVLWPGLANMRFPVLAYSGVLTAMAITAQRSRFGNLVSIGSLLFVASDTMLAMSIFGHPFSGSRILVWLTYYAAQVMIAVGVVRAARPKVAIAGA